MVLIQNFQTKSGLSKYFEFLIKASLIPLILNKSTNQLTFKYLSFQFFKVMFYTICTGSIFVFFNLYLFGLNPWGKFYSILFGSTNKTDALAYFAMIQVMILVNFGFPQFCRDITKISTKLILGKNLKCPKNGRTFACISVLNILTTTIWSILTFEATMAKSTFTNYNITWMIIGNSIFVFQQQIAIFHLLLFSLSWLENFSLFCKRSNYDDIYHHSHLSLEIYNSLQRGLGTTLLAFFSLVQVQTIIAIYMCISTIFFGTGELFYNISLSICYAFMATYNGTIMYYLIIAAEEAFESMKKLEPLLEAKLSEENYSLKIKLLLKEIENLKPLNGNGYFEMKKETLTSIISTTVTYLIILLQFKNA